MWTRLIKLLGIAGPGRYDTDDVLSNLRVWVGLGGFDGREDSLGSIALYTRTQKHCGAKSRYALSLAVSAALSFNASAAVVTLIGDSGTPGVAGISGNPPGGGSGGTDGQSVKAVANAADPSNIAVAIGGNAGNGGLGGSNTANVYPYNGLDGPAGKAGAATATASTAVNGLDGSSIANAIGGNGGNGGVLTTPNGYLIANTGTVGESSLAIAATLSISGNAFATSSATGGVGGNSGNYNRYWSVTGGSAIATSNAQSSGTGFAATASAVAQGGSNGLYFIYNLGTSYYLANATSNSIATSEGMASASARSSVATQSISTATAIGGSASAVSDAVGIFAFASANATGTGIGPVTATATATGLPTFNFVANGGGTATASASGIDTGNQTVTVNATAIGAPLIAAINNRTSIAGVATLGSVSGVSTGGAVFVTGIAIGGGPTPGQSSLNLQDEPPQIGVLRLHGGDGGNALAVNAVSGRTSGPLTLNQSATGGNAMPLYEAYSPNYVPLFGGNGGDAISTLSSTTGNASTSTLAVKALGGNGSGITPEVFARDGLGGLEISGRGGNAHAEATLNGTGPMTINVVAQGGTGGLGEWRGVDAVRISEQFLGSYGDTPLKRIPSGAGGNADTFLRIDAGGSVTASISAIAGNGGDAFAVTDLTKSYAQYLNFAGTGGNATLSQTAIHTSNGFTLYANLVGGNGGNALPVKLPYYTDYPISAGSGGSATAVMNDSGTTLGAVSFNIKCTGGNSGNDSFGRYGSSGAAIAILSYTDYVATTLKGTTQAIGGSSDSSKGSATAHTSLVGPHDVDSHSIAATSDPTYDFDSPLGDSVASAHSTKQGIASADAQSTGFVAVAAYARSDSFDAYYTKAAISGSTSASQSGRPSDSAKSHAFARVNFGDRSSVDGNPSLVSLLSLAPSDADALAVERSMSAVAQNFNIAGDGSGPKSDILAIAHMHPALEFGTSRASGTVTIQLAYLSSRQDLIFGMTGSPGDVQFTVKDGNGQLFAERLFSNNRFSASGSSIDLGPIANLSNSGVISLTYTLTSSFQFDMDLLIANATLGAGDITPEPSGMLVLCGFGGFLFRRVRQLKSTSR